VSDRDPVGWHLDKKVPLSIFVALAVQAVAGVLFVADTRSRVERLEQTRVDAQATQRERDERQDSQNAESFSQVRTQLEKMDAKLDRLIESRR